MSHSQSFVDLRASTLSSGSHTDDSVWPSFTDIMTVVVMIFLMSLVVILLRNVELVKSEQESTRLAQIKASENVELETLISNLEQRIVQIQLQLQAQVLKTEQSEEQFELSQKQSTRLMADIQALQLLKDKLSQENTELAASKLALEGRLKVVVQDNDDIKTLVDQSKQANLVLEDERQQLLIQLKSLAKVKESLVMSLDAEKQQVLVVENQNLSLNVQITDSQTEFDTLKAVYSLLQQDSRSLSDRISDAEKMISELEENLNISTQTIEEKQQALMVAGAKIEETTEQLQETQTKFTTLEEKYLSLVGPARSQLNKYVVRIRYRKGVARNLVEFALPTDGRFTLLSEPQLHSRLTRLKAQKGDQLYTKVIIPPDSGLSYDQAWRFTQDILTQYDYYYQ